MAEESLPHDQAEAALRRAKTPRGIMLLSLLFYAAAGLVVVATLATTQEPVPGDIAALMTIYLVILGWGLWKLYRWAWFATLIMFALSTMRLISDAALSGASIGFALLFIAIASAYLLWPKVRGIYLRNGWEPASEEPAP
ncbi:MAG TPA: hypothetical protein VGE07_27970 [Herpetosiphonaceae bacterium]